jgi:hypothetical protein
VTAKRKIATLLAAPVLALGLVAGTGVAPASAYSSRCEVPGSFPMARGYASLTRLWVGPHTYQASASNRSTSSRLDVYINDWRGTRKLAGGVKSYTGYVATDGPGALRVVVKQRWWFGGGSCTIQVGA